MSRIVVVGGLAESLINFRGELLKTLVGAGHDVIGMAGEPDPNVISRLAAMNVRFKAFPIHRAGLNPIWDMRSYRALRAAFAEFRPDVVLCYTVKPVIWGGLALKRNAGPRFYALVTGLGFALQGGGFARRTLGAVVTKLYRLSLARAALTIFQNPDNRDVFVARKVVEPGRCTVLNGSGVDLDRFSVAPLPDTAPVFLTIGRLLGDKGFREFAEAACRVRQRYPGATFRLLGPPDHSPDGIPRAEVASWQSRGWLEYLGAADDVRPAIAGCHIFVLPSYHEGMPRTVLEAMAMGRPILTTDVPGCRQTVVSGSNGYLVPKADAHALAARMIWFLEHPGEWPRMGARSRMLAEERFNVHDVNRELMKIMGLTP